MNKEKEFAIQMSAEISSCRKLIEELENKISSLKSP